MAAIFMKCEFSHKAFAGILSNTVQYRLDQITLHVSTIAEFAPQYLGQFNLVSKTNIGGKCAVGLMSAEIKHSRKFLNTFCFGVGKLTEVPT